MRRILLQAVILFALSAFSAAYAASGDIGGNVYSTDIKAYVDGMEIQSYCLEGKTAIPVEALREYGFSVTYDDKNRALFINRGSIPDNTPQFENTTSDLPVGTVVSNYYETDIKTYMDGCRIMSYALDGYTVIPIEDLTYYKHNFMQTYEMYGEDYEQPLVYAMHRPFNDLGFYHIWNESDRTIQLICLRGGYIWTNELGSFTAGNSYIYNIQKDGWPADRIVKAAIDGQGKVFTWHLLKHGVETYGLDLNPASSLLLYINTPEEFTAPSYDGEYDLMRKIITPVMSKEIIINGTPYYAENMFIAVQNYLYVRQDLFELLEKNN